MDTDANTTTAATMRILAEVAELRARIVATRRRQDGLWSDATYASVDDVDRDREAIGLYGVMIGWEQEIAALALRVTAPAPGWTGGWLLGSTAGDLGAAWLCPRDLDWRARIPAWRTRADADTALAELLAADHTGRPPRPVRQLASFTPRRPAAWRPATVEGDSGGYRICWVAATRGHTITSPGGGTLACELPLDDVGWATLADPASDRWGD